MESALDQAVSFADEDATTREEDADATRTEEREQVVHLDCISLRVEVIVDGERCADRLRNARLFEEVFEPGEVIVAFAI